MSYVKWNILVAPNYFFFPGNWGRKPSVTLYRRSTPFHWLQHNANTVSAHIRAAEKRSLVHPCKSAINPESSPAQKQEGSEFVALLWKNSYTCFVCLFYSSFMQHFEVEDH